jgi:hypothetical protein
MPSEALRQLVSDYCWAPVHSIELSQPDAFHSQVVAAKEWIVRRHGRLDVIAITSDEQ